MTPEQRITAIEKLIADFEESVIGVEQDLANRLIEAAAKLIADPAQTMIVLSGWNNQWSALIQELAQGLLAVSELNTEYFTAMSVKPAVVEEGKTVFLSAIGLTTTGYLIKQGYLSQILNDTSTARKLISLVTDAKLRKLDAGQLTAIVSPAVQGKAKVPGILTNLFNSLDTQPHVEADRVLQRAIAIRANLKASLYLGGLIESSRPFCVERNGKTFLDSETEKFGTPRDTYGGYSDKSKGLFNGKPRTGYDPFTMCGGIRCRHHRSYINNAEALRRRSDLEEKNGVLRIKKQ
ncbi:hypothetical protein [Spirosoma sp.]|uniref:hypothetical protein n=1 Tax=Spirosoma sp. TaxID=1899569 RepID=UPI00262CC5D9|nr:hypothetical protein [Spirosoma sp.]MCX6218362.1 hypothetical protein [Spirosoma sp.]